MSSNSELNKVLPQNRHQLYIASRANYTAAPYNAVVARQLGLGGCIDGGEQDAVRLQFGGCFCI